jgi:hypothetical protein
LRSGGASGGVAAEAVAARHTSRRLGAQHVEAYLDAFVFRFNRRQSNARGLLV